MSGHGSRRGAVTPPWAWHARPVPLYNAGTDETTTGTLVKYRRAESDADWQHFVVTWWDEPTDAMIVDAIERHAWQQLTDH